MAGPFTSDVHAPRPLGDEEREAARAEIEKRGMSPLYVYRRVENASEIIAWAKAQGFKTTLPADDMHVTITYSRMPVDWLAMGEPWSGPKGDGKVQIGPGGPRAIEAFGADGSAIVLSFASWDLQWRNREMQEKGASWDWAEYTPHITITYDRGEVDLDTIKPYTGKIVLGPEIFEPIDEDWSAKLVEKVRGDGSFGVTEDGDFGSYFKVAGVNEQLGLVFGWGLVCKVNGQDYWDSDRNHCPEEAMIEAVTDFMKNSRDAGEMHERAGAGTIVHSFPLTSEIAKAMGITSEKTGWMVAMAPDAAMLKKFASGEYKGFSIGGRHIDLERVAA